jgi:uncharacterized protein YkwD
VHWRRHGRSRIVRDIARVNIRATFFLLAILSLAACATEPSAPPGPPDPKTQMGALETRIAILVEEQRHRLDPKARPLAIDPELSRIARARASDMAAGNYLAHAAPNGDTSATLLMAEDAQYQGLLGENLAARHYNPGTGLDVDAFAKSFVDTWLASPPHKENLSFADYNLTGVGAAVNGDTVYVTQLFSTDLGMGPHRPGTPAAVATSFPDARTAKAAGTLRGPLVPAQ